MIKFKTTINYRYYFLGSMYRLVSGKINRLFLVFFLLMGTLNFLLRNYTAIIAMISILGSFYFIFPLIRLVSAKFYYKINYVEYFFGNESFGWLVGKHGKLEIPKHQIKYIKAQTNGFVIKVPKHRYFFFAAKSKALEVKKKLLASDYKRYIQER